MGHFLKLCVIAIGLNFIHSCGVLAADRLPVLVSIIPQKYLLQQIGKDLVDVQVMVQPGANPATYEPKPRQMAAVALVKVYFAIGVPFESVWLKKIAALNPQMRVVHTDRGIAKRPMATHVHETDERAPHQQQGIFDPHIWLAPPLVINQAHTILAALQEIDPAHAAVYAANCKRFTAELARLDAELHRMFDDLRGLRFMVFHPSWGYFAHTYGLEQVPIEIEGKAPKPARLSALIRRAKSLGIKVVFVQPQFSEKSAALIAREIGGRVVAVDPLALNWAQNLRDVARQIRDAVK